jgi:hypothetical protein
LSNDQSIFVRGAIAPTPRRYCAITSGVLQVAETISIKKKPSQSSGELFCLFDIVRCLVAIEAQQL